MMEDKEADTCLKMEALRAPFPPQEIKWRPADFSGKKSSPLVYIDARNVDDRLDDVIGPDNWEVKFNDSGDRCSCALSVRFNDGWVTKVDVGIPSNIEGIKGMYSDAYKRAAVHYGIGRYLYAGDLVSGKFEMDGNQFSKKSNEKIEAEVRKHYRFYGGNEKERIMSLIFRTATTSKSLHRLQKDNQETLKELKGEDSAALRRVQSIFKQRESMLKKMEESK